MPGRQRPKFMDSPYFIPELDNWHLAEGAPEEVKKEFEEFVRFPDCVEITSEEEYIKFLTGKKRFLEENDK